MHVNITDSEKTSACSKTNAYKKAERFAATQRLHLATCDLGTLTVRAMPGHGLAKHNTPDTSLPSSTCGVGRDSSMKSTQR
jgi:hypothetical protein